MIVRLNSGCQCFGNAFAAFGAARGEVLNKFSNCLFYLSTLYTPRRANQTMAILIADSGSTKCEWAMVSAHKQENWITGGMSPYFLDAQQMEHLVRTELLPHLEDARPEAVYFYGTGCKDKANARRVAAVLEAVFPAAAVSVDNDMAGAARALCGRDAGIACILGTGSGSCVYDGSEVTASSTGLGYVLGDEGSGAYLGKKVIQYHLYGIFEESLQEKFRSAYQADAAAILEKVYRQPLPNRYLASFSHFLSENRGHYMIENIIEDGINDFFRIHIDRFGESRRFPVHFTGGVAHAFGDVVLSICDTYALKPGTILKNPMEGLVNYHRAQEQIKQS